MKNIKDLPDYIISLYKGTVWKKQASGTIRGY